MTSADQRPDDSQIRSPIVAAEVGSARMEGADPDGEVVALADAFAAGELSEADFDSALDAHQQAVVAESRQRLFIAGRE